MGIRLYVIEKKEILCGGKLYGYTKTNEDMEALKYLWERFEGAWIEEYGYSDFEDFSYFIGIVPFLRTPTLKGREMKKFIELYNEDYEKHKHELPWAYAHEEVDVSAIDDELEYEIIWS